MYPIYHLFQKGISTLLKTNWHIIKNISIFWRIYWSFLFTTYFSFPYEVLKIFIKSHWTKTQYYYFHIYFQLDCFSQWQGKKILPKITSAKLLFSTNSYTRIHWSWSPKQQPLSFIRFLWLTLVTSATSLENSLVSCCVFVNNNLTAISLPSGSTPCKH